jgi:ligand-binding sensor domain-containing protein
LPFKSVTSLLEDKSGNIWIGRMDGLTRYNPSANSKTGEESFTDLFTDFLTYYIIQDKSGNIWMTHSEPPDSFHPKTPKQVLYRYDGKPPKASHAGGGIFTKILEKNEPGDYQLFGKTEDSSGNIWFGTMKGPCRYNPAASPNSGTKAFTNFSD